MSSKINIIDLFNRFKVFSYSTFQRYFKSKCKENSCKKELILYLNDIYHLEYKSRKKIINLFTNEELIELSKLLSLSELEQYKFSIVKILIEKLNKKNNLLFNEFIYKSTEFFITEFDNLIIYNILKNVKLNKHKISINIFNNFHSLSLNKDNERVLLIAEFNEFLEIQEAIRINSNVTLKDLKEPRWVKKNRTNKIDYIDYCFNLMTIELENNKPSTIKYNGNIILDKLRLSLYKKYCK